VCCLEIGLVNKQFMGAPLRLELRVG
jgi:hypothetical protein